MPESKSGALPLGYTPTFNLRMVEEDGFEPPNPLGNDLQSSAFGLFATPPQLVMVDAEGLEPPTPAL